jgi:hypothetical protein
VLGSLEVNEQVNHRSRSRQGTGVYPSSK